MNKNFISTDIYRILGERIKYLREKNNLTQEELSELVNITPNYLSQLENGKKKPSLNTIYKIAQALNISLSELFSVKNITLYKKGKNSDSYSKKINSLLTNLNDKEKLFIMDIIKGLKKYKK